VVATVPATLPPAPRASVLSTNAFPALGSDDSASDDDVDTGCLTLAEYVNKSVENDQTTVADLVNNRLPYVPAGLTRGYADRDIGDITGSDTRPSHVLDNVNFPALPMSAEKTASGRTPKTMETILEELRTAFANGKTWADICCESDDEDDYY
jgi:hypothetical protein